MHALTRPGAALRIGSTVLLLGALFFAVPAIATDASGAGKDSSEQMHRAMIEDMNEMNAMQMSGDIDQDFAQMMRKHHQSGVAMAERELRSGKDPEMLKMARKIIAEQKKEIDELDKWLKAHAQTKK